MWKEIRERNGREKENRIREVICGRVNCFVVVSFFFVGKVWLWCLIFVISRLKRIGIGGRSCREEAHRIREGSCGRVSCFVAIAFALDLLFCREILIVMIHIRNLATKGQSVWWKKRQRRNGSKKRMQLLKQNQNSELLSRVSHWVARWRIVESLSSNY